MSTYNGLRLVGAYSVIVKLCVGSFPALAASIQARDIMGGVAPTLCIDLNTCTLYQIHSVQVGGELRTLQSRDAALHISPMSHTHQYHIYPQIFSRTNFAERWFSDSLALA